MAVEEGQECCHRILSRVPKSDDSYHVIDEDTNFNRGIFVEVLNIGCSP